MNLLLIALFSFLAAVSLIIVMFFCADGGTELATS